MRQLTRVLALALAYAAWSGVLCAQGRGGGAEWPVPSADAQRSSWIRTDAAISIEAMLKPAGFELQWKTKLENQARQQTSLLQGITVNGVTLFTPLSIVTGSSNNVFAIDNDTGNTFWQRHFDVAIPASTTNGCPGGITAAPTRMTNLNVPPPAGGRGAAGGGGGRGGYSSGVGEPGEGAPVPARGAGGGRAGAGGGGAGANPPAAGAAGAAAGAGGAGAAGAAGAGAAGAATPPAGRGADPTGRGADPTGRGANPAGGRGADPAAAGRAGGGGGGGFGRSSGMGYVISSDGALHALGFPSGKDVQKPAPFVPANARFSDPIAVNNILYTTTSGNCGGAADAVWALDLSSENKNVTSWRTNGGGPIGSVAFTNDGTLIVSVAPGPSGMGSYANAIVALDAKSLQPKDWYTPSTSQIASAPIVFTENGKDIVAATLKDGRIVLLDASSLGGANHSTPLYTSRSFGAASASALATWQEMIPAPAAAAAPAAPAGGGAPPAGAAGAGGQAAPPPAPAMQPGTRWLLLPVSGALPADLRTPMATQPAVTNGAIVALKVASGADGKLSLQPAWISHDLTEPVTPLVVNGVVFALSSGKAPATGAAAGRGTPAVLYAINGMTGAELWNSGNAMTSFTTGRSFWCATGQVYVGTFDGTVYAFGFAMERK